MKTIFIGPFGNGGVPKDGASIKNYHILNKLRLLSHELKAIDTDNWKKRPGMLAGLLLTILRNRNARYILSLNNASAHKVIRILKSLAPDAKVIYWVIGGSIGKWLQEGRMNPIDFAQLQRIIVEGETMKAQLESCGLGNVNVLPNFKKIINVSKSSGKGEKTKFVFLSRILPEKGCDLILEASRVLNQQGFQNLYEIDFFGPIQDNYKDEFITKINGLENVAYKGFLDLRNPEKYSELAGYDAMLFPTFWPGEGCPGIVMDAYMCGLPILASDWNMNSDYIQSGKNGVLFEPKNLNALTETMKNAINGDYNLEEMSKCAIESIKRYDIENVLSIENLKELEILD